MLTSPKSPRFRAMPRQRHIVPSATLFLVITMMLIVTVTSGSQQSAGATEFYGKPVLEAQWACNGGNVFHYHALMYNQGNDWTTFTVTSSIGNGPTTTVDHQVAPQDVEILDFVVPEDQQGHFHIVALDAPGIDELTEPFANCWPDIPSTTTTTSTTVPPTTTTTSTTTTTAPKATTTTSTTSTTSTTLPAVVLGTSTIVPKTSTTTTSAYPVAVEAASANRSPDALAVTGSKTTPLGWIGFGLLALGLALWMLSVRLRYAFEN